MPPDQPKEPSTIERALDSVNAGYVAELYEQYQRDPTSVEREWRVMFESGQAGFEPAPAGRTARDTQEGNGTGPTIDAAPRAEAAEPAPSPPVSPATQQLPAGAAPIKGPAARLARNMTASLAIPTATSFRDVDVSGLEARRRDLNAQGAPRKVSFTHLIGWAIVRAATDQPAMTHYFAEAEGDALRVDPGGVSLGLAVDVERPDG
ncbi:MAG TPA: 2-oxo acid dehydrogenase subunit E2, partial [Candidatus Limnocylindria bacterium]|nr:2-oxo acid dehydrogenase subunit E2 [Candidatus Limnocylindria bacterium]